MKYIPRVHLWLLFKNLKSIYPINKTFIVTEDDLKHENDDRWVELPNDETIKSIYELSNLCEIKKIGVEFMEFNNNTPKGFTWPRTERDIFPDLKIGNIIDAKDTQHNLWYEGMIRKVIYDNDNLIKSIIVHYIGWLPKWNECIHVSTNNDRIAVRNTHTFGPSIPKWRKMKMDEYNESSELFGFFKST